LWIFHRLLNLLKFFLQPFLMAFVFCIYLSMIFLAHCSIGFFTSSSLAIFQFQNLVGIVGDLINIANISNRSDYAKNIQQFRKFCLFWQDARVPSAWAMPNKKCNTEVWLSYLVRWFSRYIYAPQRLPFFFKLLSLRS